jgi:hypothetical protein
VLSKIEYLPLILCLHFCLALYMGQGALLQSRSIQLEDLALVSVNDDKWNAATNCLDSLFLLWMVAVLKASLR